MSPLHDPANDDHVARYAADLPYVCLACQAIEWAQRKYAKAYGADGMAGTKWVAELVPRTRPRL